MMEVFIIDNCAKNDCPVVISIPHSATYVPEYIRKLMRPAVMLPNSDWYLPELYSFFTDMGITQIKSNISRYVIDLNRDLNGGIAGDYHNLVYESTTQGKPIYNASLQSDDINHRINKYYLPYHTALEQLIENKLKYHSKVYLFDMHSFFLNFTDADDGDIILSDYDHAAASPQTLELIKEELEKVGYKVTENTIKGGYITRKYGAKYGLSVESIQIELRYTAYLENRYFGEEVVEKYDETLFSSAQQHMKQAFTKLFIKMTQLK